MRNGGRGSRGIASGVLFFWAVAFGSLVTGMNHESSHHLMSLLVSVSYFQTMGHLNRNTGCDTACTHLTEMIGVDRLFSPTSTRSLQPIPRAHPRVGTPKRRQPRRSLPNRFAAEGGETLSVEHVARLLETDLLLSSNGLNFRMQHAASLARIRVKKSWLHEVR